MACKRSRVRISLAPPFFPSMQFLPEFFTVALIHLLALMSPGPDFVMISRNSLIYSRRSGIYSAIGLACGMAVHATYSLIGIGLIIAKSVVLFSILKFVGAAYLIYFGYFCLRAKPNHLQNFSTEKHQDLTRIAALRIGFLTNILNPKATLFFLALFTQVVSPETPKFIQILYAIEMCFATFVWFAFVAIILSGKKVRAKFVKTQHWFERIFGVLLIGLGAKVALTSAR